MTRGQLAGQALCMEQYYRLLRSYRLPGKECDRLLLFRNSLLVPTDGSDVNSVLIVVSYRNQVSFVKFYDSFVGIPIFSVFCCECNERKLSFD